MSKKLLILIFTYLLPLLLLAYLLAPIFSSKTTNAYAKISKGQPISILVVGDSIGEGQGASKPERNFPNRLKSLLQKKYNVTASIENICMGGNTTYASYVRTYQLPNSNVFDLVIICSGENDYEKKPGVFYEALVRTVKTKYPNAEIISVLQHSQKTYTQKIKAIQNIADHYGISTADTIPPFTNGENGDYQSLTVDNIHPNDKGYAIYAQVLEETISANVKNHHPSPKNLPSNIFPDSLNYAVLTSIPTTSLTRTENTFTGTIDLPKTTSIKIGIELDNFKGSNSYELAVNNTKIFQKQFKWKFPQKHFITQLAAYKPTNATTTTQLSITFGTQNQADSFKGFFISYPTTTN